MENVIKFPARAPQEGEMMTVSLDEMFQVLSKRKTLQDIAWERRHAEIMSTLDGFDVPTLRRMWDEISDHDSFYHGPEGDFDCSDIHLALNLKGDGIYCAV